MYFSMFVGACKKQKLIQLFLLGTHHQLVPAEVLLKVQGYVIYGCPCPNGDGGQIIKKHESVGPLFHIKLCEDHPA